MRLYLLSCEILYREICAAAARSPHRVDLHFLPKRLHDIGACQMRARLEEALGDVNEAHYDAILLGYGLCNNGLVGLAARTIPLVLPRAHDCITLFLGGKERYQAVFSNHPGTYFLTTGWIERGQEDSETVCNPVPALQGFNADYKQLVEKYGEENARYLMEQLGDLTRNYDRCAFIEMGVEPDGRFARFAQEEANKRGWAFDHVQGDLSLIQRLVDGEWSKQEFLVIPPGSRIAPSYDETIIQIEEPAP